MTSLYKKTTLLFFSLCLLVQLTFAASIADFEEGSYTNPVTKTVMKYRLFKPKNYDKTKLYPLVGFLHGAGEFDWQNNAQVTANDGCLYWADDSIQNKYPSFIVAPNLHGNGETWANSHWSKGNYNQDDITISEGLQNYINIIQELRKTYSIDSNRIYQTGLSMGGGGTWASLTRFPNLFAAAIPICGYGDPSKMSLIKHIPIWTFHGKDDFVVNTENTRKLVAALKAAGGNVRYDEVPEPSGKDYDPHFVWLHTYHRRGKGYGLADWLFAQKKKGAITASEGLTSIALSIKAFPNPSNGNITLTLPNESFYELQVWDGTGKLVFNKQINNSLEQKLDLGGLPKGIYSVSAVGATTQRISVLVD
ncbi:MAG TPA: T9SS type A sorting domain-containing protein [Cytophagaceae bacterium]|jgi:predicted peptidase